MRTDRFDADSQSPGLAHAPRNASCVERRRAGSVSRHHALFFERVRRDGEDYACRDARLCTVNYSLDDREAEQRLLPLAAERGMAVLVNLPFGQGRLLRTLRGKPVPSWMQECRVRTWPEVLLKFTLAHKAVTCVIPGTGNPDHMVEKFAAQGMGDAGRFAGQEIGRVASVERLQPVCLYHYVVAR